MMTSGNRQQQQMVNGSRTTPMGPGSHVPPPYRSPPPHPQKQGAYSKFNVSEPNIMGGGFLGSPVTGYRHTINSENSQKVQHTLRHMLNTNQPPHANGQHPKKTHNGPGDTYVSPDHLRDAANRMFTRNQERSSFAGTPQHYQPPGPQPPMNGTLDRKQPFYANQPRQLPSVNSRFSNHAQGHDDASRRNSIANHSLKRGAIEQYDHQNVNGQSGKTPPQVPPKPNSRSTSRERLKESMEEVDNLDLELKHILRSGINNPGNQRLSIGGGTPTLPALSPDPTPEASPEQNGRSKAMAKINGEDKNDRVSQMKAGMRKYQEELAQSSFGALTADLESVLGGLQTDLTSDESTTVDVGEAAAIRRQLDGLENMYAEVLKMLGLRKYGRAPNAPNLFDGPKLRRGNKLYGSMSSLPSVSSIGSRHIYKNRGPGDKSKRPNSSGGGSSKDRSYNKRFQRLESHVVTLARSVAHLSSEMRNQTLLIQEVEALRLEIQQLRGAGPSRPQAGPPTPGHGQGYVDPESFFAAAAASAGQSSGNQRGAGGVNRVQANRVRKLTKFFGEAPPLLRLWLKNLGYEKFASAFEEAKIGLLELPYLSDDKLDKLGIPMGPRMRIMQEAKASIANEPNFNVYIL